MCFFSAISYNPKKLTQTISGLAVLALITTSATAQTVGYFAAINAPFTLHLAMLETMAFSP